MLCYIIIMYWISKGHGWCKMINEVGDKTKKVIKQCNNIIKKLFISANNYNWINNWKNNNINNNVIVIVLYNIILILIK